MRSDDKWKSGTITFSCSLGFSPFLVPLKENELMFVGSAATCCGAFYRIWMGQSLVRPQRNIQREREDDAFCHDHSGAVFGTVASQ